MPGRPKRRHGTVGDALGKADEAWALLPDIDASVAAAAAEHPQLQGLSVAASRWTPPRWTSTPRPTPRVRYLQDLGFTVAPCVAELTIGESAFFDTVATVVGEAQISSVSPRTALSLTWGLDALVEALAQAAAAADA